MQTPLVTARSNPRPLTLRVLSAISEVEEAAWDALLAPAAPPFVRWRWIHALEDSGSASVKTGWEPRHLTLWSGETLIAAAPAYRKFHSMGEYIYDFGWAHAAEQLGVDYYPKLLLAVPLSPATAPRFLVAPAEDAQALTRLLAEAAESLAREMECSSLHILFPPEREVTALEPQGLLRRATLQFHWHNPGYTSYEAFLSRFNAKRRHQLKRERAAAGEQGIAITTHTGAALTPKHALLAYKFYEATTRRKSWGAVQLNRGFFERVFRWMPEQVELVEATRGGETLAGAFNLRTKTHLYGRYWGAFEDVPFLHFNVCFYHSIETCIAEGRTVFEPGAGGEHKMARGFEPTVIHSLHRIFNAPLQKAIARSVVREREAVEAEAAEALAATGMRPWDEVKPPLEPKS